jgi:beta-phosphoglucomutase
MKASAVIFDVDGVLMDSVPYHFNAWQETFREHGSELTFEDYVEKLNGLPRLVGVRNILPNSTEAEIETIGKKKQDRFLFLVHEKHPTPLPGVVPFLKKLQKLGVTIGAASSSKNAPLLLKLAGIADYFKAIVSGHDFKKSKPDPEIFLTAALKIGHMPSTCVVFEDAVLGIHAAKRAGMYAVGLLNSGDSMITEHADVTLPSLKQHKIFIDLLE